jgi:hypothetical protein
MADLYFINKNTTVDEIIDQILYELNNEFLGSSLCVPHFCVPTGKENHEYDQRKELQVRTKMINSGIVTANQNSQGRMYYVSLAEPGTHFPDKGDWLNYIKAIELEQKKEKEQKIKSEKPQQHIFNHGNMVVGDNPQGITQGSDLGNSRFNNNSTILETNIASEHPHQDAITTNKKEESIFNKIYRWTDHKTISIIIGAILGFLGSKILKYFDLF